MYGNGDRVLDSSAATRVVVGCGECSSAQSHVTYYVVSQSNRWMRQLGAPAAIEETAGQSPWTPTVSGQQKKYLLTLTSYNRDLDSREASVGITLDAIVE